MPKKENNKVAFGIEYEVGFIDPKDRPIENVDDAFEDDEDEDYNTDREWCYRGFEFHEDSTAGTEIVTPPLSKPSKAADLISQQWRGWIRNNEGISPNFQNDEYHEMGHHIHIGIPRAYLDIQEKRMIASRAIKILPLLMAVSANDKRYTSMSWRGTHSDFCEELKKDVIGASHYKEISNSELGTVEFRIFDCNIPQVSLTNAVILQAIAKKALEDGKEIAVDIENYRKERKNALKYGLKGIDVDQYKISLRELVDDINFFRYPKCVKEILFLAIKKRLSVASFIREYNYEFCKTMGTNSKYFFDNLLKMKSLTETDKSMVKKWIEEVKEFRTLKELCAGKMNGTEEIIVSDVLNLLGSGENWNEAKQIINDRYDYNDKILQNINVVLSGSKDEIDRLEMTKKDELTSYNNNLISSLTEECIKRSNNICRIGKMNGRTNLWVANQISAIMKQYFKKEIKPDKIISASERFYVFTSNNRVLGFVALDIRHQKIKRLLIDKRVNKYKYHIRRRIFAFINKLFENESVPSLSSLTPYMTLDEREHMINENIETPSRSWWSKMIKIIGGK